MQKRYLNYNHLYPLIRLVLIALLASQGLWAQAQNPFDLKSRENIDSIEQKSNILPKANSLEIKKDSPVHVTEEIEPKISEENKKPLTLNKNAVVTDKKINDTQVQDSSMITEETEKVASSNSLDLSTPPPPTQEIKTQPTKRINIKDDITLSGEQSKKITWWYYVFDFILLLILLGAFIYDKNIFSPLRKAFLHENFLRFLYRDSYLRKPGLYIYLNVLFTLSLGFILFRVTQYFGWASTFRDYLVIQSVVLFLFILKHAALYFLAQLVDKPFEVKFYQYWMILSAGILGLWMIPLALFISVLPAQYLHIAIIIISIPVILALIFRQAKALLHAKFFLSKHFFQYFLYFCGVEIVPAVLLADVLIQY